MRALAALLLAAAPCLSGELATEHYDLRAEGVPLEDTGRLLEALHARLSDHFHAAPEGRLRVVIYGTKERFRAAMLADGEVPPEAGGYYSPRTRKAYLWVQPSEFFTRQLVLHEATHQFHYLVATGNRTPGAWWYTEGLAEYFGMHDWDGERLETGVVPPITLEDYPARALAQYGEAKDDLEGIVAGRVTVDRPLAWALIHFLVNVRGEEFGRIAAELDAQRGAPDLQGSAAAEFRDWIEANQQPWRILWVGWQGRGEAIEGASPTNALAALKEAPDRLETEIEGTFVWAGVAFGVKSVDDFWLVQAGVDGRARVVRRAGGNWRVEKTTSVEAKGPRRVAVSVDGDRVEAFVDGVSLGTYEAPGDVGLNVDAGKARFRVDGAR